MILWITSTEHVIVKCSFYINYILLRFFRTIVGFYLLNTLPLYAYKSVFLKLHESFPDNVRVQDNLNISVLIFQEWCWQFSRVCEVYTLLRGVKGIALSIWQFVEVHKSIVMIFPVTLLTVLQESGARFFFTLPYFTI